MSDSDRFCIFCGRRPENKNKEHVLPKWLLEFTGNPRRNVVHGVQWGTGKLIEYAWDKFVFPACESCNLSYGQLEGAVRPVIEAICKGESLKAKDYILLLDWFDKVRIGLWLGWRYLQGLSNMPRHFTITDRLAIKDRMIAVYPIGDRQPKGLNYYGPDSPAFNSNPCALALRINNRLFINASWDFMCSKECGWPYPQNKRVLLDENHLLEVNDFRASCKPERRVWPFLPKAAVLLFQPIPQKTVSGQIQSTAEFNKIRHNVCQQQDPQKSALYRQRAKRMQIICDQQQPISFDKISVKSARTASEITSNVYDILNLAIESYDWISCSSDRLKTNYQDKAMQLKYNTAASSLLRENPEHQGRRN